MKHVFLMTGLAAAILIGAGAKGNAAGVGPAMGPRPPSFQELDADGDGQVTLPEMKAHMQTRFEAADSDGDGALSREELSARIEARQVQRRNRMLDRMFTRRDTDGDGLLRFEEMRAPGPDEPGRIFARHDGDGDGALSEEEFEAMKERHGRHRPGMRKRVYEPDSD